MGIFGDIFDMGMEAAYKYSAGFVGKSDEGYHFGPVRVSDTSCSVIYKTGLLNLELKIERSDYGSWQPAVGIGLGIPGRAEIRVETQITKEGFTIAPSLSVNAGPVKIGGGLTLDQDFNVTNLEVTGTAGPVCAKFKTTTAINLKEDVDFEKLCKNTKVDIDYEYSKNKVEEMKKEQEERKKINAKEVREENKSDKKTNVTTRQRKKHVKADELYCDICKSFNCIFNK